MADPKNKTVEQILTVAKWIFSVFFLLGSIKPITTGSAVLSGIMFLVIGLLIFPPLVNFWRRSFPFLANRIIKAVIIVILCMVAGFAVPADYGKARRKKHSSKNQTDSTDQLPMEEEKKLSEKENPKPPLLKIITTDISFPYTKKGYENIRTYTYGVYFDFPADTTGMVDQIMRFLREKTAVVESHEVVTLWVFSDSSVIPRSFKGDWGTTKSTKKCFAHAARLSNGNYVYDYDMFGAFER